MLYRFMYVDLLITLKMLVTMSAYLWAARAPVAVLDRLVLTVSFSFAHDHLGLLDPGILSS